MPTSYSHGALQWVARLFVSCPRAVIAQVGLLNAYLTTGNLKTFIDIKPFQRRLTTWLKDCILWESPSLMKQLIARISKLHWEPSALLWRCSSRALRKSPGQHASASPLRRPAVIDSSAYWFGIGEQVPGGWCLWVRGRIWWGGRGPEGEAHTQGGAERRPYLTRPGSTRAAWCCFPQRTVPTRLYLKMRAQKGLLALWGKKMF